MSSRRNNNKCLQFHTLSRYSGRGQGEGLSPIRCRRGAARSQGTGAAAGLVIFIVLVMFLNRGQKHAPPPRPGPVGPGYQRVVRNPIEDMIAPPPERQLSDGVALAILVDVSGSMQEPVPDASGVRRPKIDIAKRCVLNLVTQTEKAAKDHPDRPILLGIYEFSTRNNQPSCRNILPLAAPSLAAAQSAVPRMRPNGGTPIGDAIIAAKQDLDRTAKRRLHILVVTDGENNHGYSPADVASAISRLPDDGRPNLYFIAFDIAAAKFASVRDAGALVMSAANETELRQTMDYLLTGKILAEQPPAPTGR